MYLLVIYFGLAHLLFHPIAKMSIWCFGIIMLLVLGIQTIRGAFKPKELQGSTSVSDRNPIVAGFLLAIINPTSIAWWLGVFGTTMAASNEPVSFLALLHNSTIILGVILWFLFLSSLLHFGKSWIGPRYMRWVPVGAGTLLIALAGYFGWQAVQDLQQLIA
jgi:threonine/homoserine/homoserine lactone efflux protein